MLAAGKLLAGRKALLVTGERQIGKAWLIRNENEAIPSVYDCRIASFLVVSLRCNENFFSRRRVRFKSQYSFTAVYSAAGASDSEAVSSVFASPEVSSAWGASVAGAAEASFAASSSAIASAASFASAAASATVV